MKKILYVLMLALVSTLSFSACTEEAVTPKTEEAGSGTGGGSNDPIKP
jgi:hypothetical protein